MTPLFYFQPKGRLGLGFLYLSYEYTIIMFGIHEHQFVERKEDREETMTFIKFVFVCIKCGALETKIVNPKHDFEVRL